MSLKYILLSSVSLTPLPHSFPRSLSFPSHVLTYSLASSPCSRPVCSLPQKRRVFAQLRRIYKNRIRFHPDGEKRGRGSRQGTRRRGHVQRSRKDGGPGRLSPAAALPTGADGPVVPLRGEGWRSGEGAAGTFFAAFCFSHLLGWGRGGAEGLNLTPSLGCPLSRFWETIPS